MFAGIQRERDPNLIHMESEVFGLLRAVGIEEDRIVGYSEPPPKSSLLAPLSFEDAIKELNDMRKNLK
jgi:hypothetical protein